MIAPPRDRPTPASRVALVVLLLGAAAPMAPSHAGGQIPGRGVLGGDVSFLTHSVLGTVTGTLPNLGTNGYAVNAKVEAESSTLFGGSVGWELRPSLKIRGRAGYTTSHMRLIVDAGPLGGDSSQRYTFDGLGDVAVWLMDVDVAWAPWRIPLPVVPYVFGGIGATRWHISGLQELGVLPPLLVSPLTLSPVTTFLPGVVAGIGVEVGATGPWHVAVEAGDHVTGDPLSDDDFQIGTNFSGRGAAKDLVHNLTLTASVRWVVGN